MSHDTEPSTHPLALPGVPERRNSCGVPKSRGSDAGRSLECPASLLIFPSCVSTSATNTWLHSLRKQPICQFTKHFNVYCLSEEAHSSLRGRQAGVGIVMSHMGKLSLRGRDLSSVTQLVSNCLLLQRGRENRHTFCCVVLTSRKTHKTNYTPSPGTQEIKQGTLEMSLCGGFTKGQMWRLV